MSFICIYQHRKFKVLLFYNFISFQHVGPELFNLWERPSLLSKENNYRYLLYINYSIYSILLDLSSIGWTEKHTAGKTKDWTPRQRANQAPPPIFFLNKYQDMHDYSHVHVDVGHMILWAYKRRDLLLIAFWEFFSPVLLLCLCNHQTFCALCVAARDKEFSKTFSTYHHCCHLYIDI